MQTLGITTAVPAKPPQTPSYTAGVIRRYHRQIGSAGRELKPGQQALLVLAHLSKGETFADLAARFGIGTAGR